MVYADIDGNIGYQAPGLIPIRKNGDGRIPVPGWTDEFEWIGFIPFDELPTLYNPATGYVATANNPVADGSYPYLLTTDWNHGDRAARIVEMIEADSSIDFEDIAAMQFDNRNRHADRLVPWFTAVDVIGESGTVVRAHELLSAWDRNNDADSAGAAIFEAVWRNLLMGTFHDEPVLLALHDAIRRHRAESPGHALLDFLPQQAVVLDPLGRPSKGRDDSTTAAVEDRDDILTAAFLAGVAELREMMGGDPDDWEWGRVHGAEFRNETLGESGVGFIESRFNRGPVPAAGGTDLVNATGWRAEEGYEVDWVPSMRMIIDLSDLDNSLAIHTTGQSGHAYNSHYQDMMEPWSTGEYLPMEWDRETVELGAEGKLVLRPAE